MPLSSRPGVFRYILLAIVLRAFSKGFEAMGDRAVLIAGVGHGEGVPYYLVALVFLLGALAAFVFAMRRWYLRVTGKGQPAEPAPVGNARDIVALSQVFDDERGETAFDPDAALARYMARKPQDATASEPPRGGFGRKGL